MLKTNQEFMYEGLGVVHLTVRRNASSFSARWRDGKVYLVVPPSATEAKVMELLGEWREPLLSRRPATSDYTRDTVLEYDGFSVSLVHRSTMGGYVKSEKLGGAGCRFAIVADFDSGDTAARDIVIGKHLRNIAKFITGRYIVPMARDIAAELGLTVREWSVGYGRNRMGCCSQSGAVRLSQELALRKHSERVYTICHELAHLTHFDHSPQFHALTARYVDRIMQRWPDWQSVSWFAAADTMRQ